MTPLNLSYQIEEIRHYLAQVRRSRPPGHDATKFAAAALERFNDPNTRRLMLDARQAAVFSEVADNAPPENVQERLRLPFESFYVELTAPLEIGLEEPGFPTETYVAFACWPNGRIKGRDAYLLSFYYRGQDGTWGDHEFNVELETGQAFVTKIATQHRWVNGRLELHDSANVSDLPEHWQPLHVFEACSYLPELPTRRIGWWELHVRELANFFSWFLSYVMSKSVRFTRMEAQPRNLNPKRKAPKRMPVPWHMITIEPQFAQGVSDHPGLREHTYRYDVIGHLRFISRINAEGLRVREVTWVRPHQRGLKHTTYIPKTYAVRHGRQVAKEAMDEYFRP